MTGEPWPPDDPRWEDDAATERYGPSPPPPPRPASSSPRSRWWWVLVVVVVVGAGLGHRSFTGREVEENDRAAGPWEPSIGCREVPTGHDDHLEQIIAIDVDARCPWIVTYDRRTATLDLGDRGRYRMGAPADLLLVGDWDCDGVSTPALYRPSDGRTFLFAAWADGTTVASAVAESTTANGEPRVVHRDGCDHLVVEAPA